MNNNRQDRSSSASTVSPSAPPSSLRLLMIASVLILIAASRITHLPGLELDGDEVWSIWQTFGTPQQIVAWTPYDWPPLSYLALGVWKGFVGIHPFVIRLLPIFAYLIGAALLYRVVAKILDKRAALFAMTAHAALGYGLYLSTILRGYVFLMALTPLALWFAIRYFGHASISIRRAVPLGLVFAVMFYIHLSSLFGYVIIGVYTLIMYPRKILRWIIPGVVAGIIAAPEITNKFWTVTAHASGSAQKVHPSLFDAIGKFYSDIAGYTIGVWVVLLTIATIMILGRHRIKPKVIALGVWALAPLPMWAISSRLDFFTPRHMWWFEFGLAAWAGWGLSLLLQSFAHRESRRAAVSLQFAAGTVLLAILALCMFWPIPLDRYNIPGPQFVKSFEWLSRNVQGDDVIIADPNVPVTPESWDYFGRVYFPLGLPMATRPEGHRRIWYLKKDGVQDRALEQAIQKNRVRRDFIGPWDALFMLWEGPPDEEGIRFENGLRFHGIDVVDSVTPTILIKREGEPLRLRIWWSVDQPLPLDYSIAVQIAGFDGSLLASFDGPPRGPDFAPETSHWVPGGYYVEERDITLPYPMSAGTYPMFLAVYQWWDNTRISAPGPRGTNGDKLLSLQPLNVKSW